MCQLFVFIVNGQLDTVCEGADNALSAERYLMSRHNDVSVYSYIANSWDECWSQI